MRDDGSRSGLRYVGWGALIVLVVAVAAGVIGYQFKLIGEERTFIDINSGDLANDRAVFGVGFDRTIVPTAFSDMARNMGLTLPDREWRQILAHGWLSGTKTDFPMSRADSACAGAEWRLRIEPTEADKKKLLAQYVKLLQAGDEQGMETLSRSVGVEQEKRAARKQRTSTEGWWFPLEGEQD